MEKENKWVVAAARLAQRLHRNQKDKAGVDYFRGHLTYVASLGKTWDEKVVGYLHDANEDTSSSIEAILTMLEAEAKDILPSFERERIAVALSLLNHHTAENREEYIRLISKNTLATAVKINDLSHNMDIQRLPHPSAKDFERLERYKKEYSLLSEGYMD